MPVAAPVIVTIGIGRCRRTAGQEQEGKRAFREPSGETDNRDMGAFNDCCVHALFS
jgi:hypothetical protein